MRHDILDHPHAGIAAERHDRFRVELNCSNRFAFMCSIPITTPSSVTAVTVNAFGQTFDGSAINRMVATDCDFMRQARRIPRPGSVDADARRLAVHRQASSCLQFCRHRPRSAIACNPRQTPKTGRSLARTFSDRGGLQSKSFGHAGPRRKHHKIRLAYSSMHTVGDRCSGR